MLRVEEQEEGCLEEEVEGMREEEEEEESSPGEAEEMREAAEVDWITGEVVEEPQRAPPPDQCSEVARVVFEVQGAGLCLVAVSQCFSPAHLRHWTCWGGGRGSFWQRPPDVPSFFASARPPGWR